MKSAVTEGIVLARTDFKEADRILVILTPDYGKIRVIAKGIRRAKSKLAGGTELFSISHITFISGRGEIGTLISSRLKEHFENIVKNLDRTMVGYELLKKINKVTEDAVGREYFELLARALGGLDDQDLSIEALDLWFNMQLLKITGHQPNLKTDRTGRALSAKTKYEFNYESTTFEPSPTGSFDANHIKLMRLGYQPQPIIYKQIINSEALIRQSLDLVRVFVNRNPVL